MLTVVQFVLTLEVFSEREVLFAFLGLPVSKPGATEYRLWKTGGSYSEMFTFLLLDRPGK